MQYWLRNLSEGSERHAGCLLFLTSLQSHATLHLQPLPQGLERANAAGRPVGEGLVEGLCQFGPHSITVHSGVGVLAEVLHSVHHAVDLPEQVELLLQGEVGHSVCHGGEHLHLRTCGWVRAEKGVVRMPGKQTSRAVGQSPHSWSARSTACTWSLSVLFVVHV